MAFPNRYSGTCCECGGSVAMGVGICLRRDGRWVTLHKEGECGEGEDLSSIKFDQYQAAVISEVRNGAAGPHVLTDAKAGSGKTTVQCAAMAKVSEQFPSLRLLCLAFGNEDGQRMRAKLAGHDVEALTTHSFCMGIVRSNYRGVKLNKKKVWELLDVVVGPDQHHQRMRGYVTELLSKVHADAVLRGDNAGIAEVAGSYELGIPEDELPRAITHVNRMLELGDDLKNYGFTFDEALYFVATRGLALPKYDLVGFDEVQDFNECQLILIRRLAAAGARVMAVGDPNQSLYAFRGARHDSFARVRETLAGDSRGYVELPMPICYRCSCAVIALAQSIVPGIEARPGAPRGDTGTEYNVADMVEVVGPTDMVLCRTNAPLVRLAWMLIAIGKRFYMRGGQLESNRLCWMIRMLSKEYGPATDDIVELMDRGSHWIDERAETASAYRLAEHKGRMEVIKLIAGRVLTVADLTKEIKRLFHPPRSIDDCVTLSTIHRAKGSESNRVFHLHPELCPHPKATTEEQKQQEENGYYVAITRASDGYFETVGELDEVAV